MLWITERIFDLKKSYSNNYNKYFSKPSLTWSNSEKVLSLNAINQAVDLIFYRDLSNKELLHRPHREGTVEVRLG